MLNLTVDPAREKEGPARGRPRVKGESFRGVATLNVTPTTDHSGQCDGSEAAPAAASGPPLTTPRRVA